MLLNDEWFRTPAYSGAILAVVRNSPGRPWFPWRTLFPPSASGAFALANHVRVLVERARSHRQGNLIRKAERWPAPRAENTIDVPLGYSRQPDKPIKSFDRRETDIYFGGSLLHDLGRRERWRQIVKRIVGNPKQFSRKAMLRELERFCVQHPALNAKITLTGESRDLQTSQVSDYATDMMDARIALAPRGTSAESYRIFEAWRYGCIVIGEPLPPRSFLQGSPAISLDSWQDLHRVLDDLLRDPARQRALHEASLSWWREVCSEQPIGRKLAAELGRLDAAIDPGVAR